MTPLKPLSSAAQIAQAMLDAYETTPGTASALAAALRVAAPQMELVQDHRKLQSIATELEGHHA